MCKYYVDSVAGMWTAWEGFSVCFRAGAKFVCSKDFKSPGHHNTTAIPGNSARIAKPYFNQE